MQINISLNLTHLPFYNTQKILSPILSSLPYSSLPSFSLLLNFSSYFFNNNSGGPLPEELLPQVKVPVRILWGENDPWEPIEMGRAAYAGFPCVDEFVTLPGEREKGWCGVVWGMGGEREK